MDIISKIKGNIAYIIGLLIIILFGSNILDYFKDTIITSLGGYTDKETVEVFKTEYIQGKIDTIAVFNHYVETQGIILNPKPVVKYVYPDTKEEGDLVHKEPIDSLKHFEVAIKDTLIEGKLDVYNKFNGDLSDVSFNYKPLFPKYITRVDTIRESKTITNTLTNNKAYVGVGAGYNSLQYLSVQGSLTLKNKTQIILGYGKPLGRLKAAYNGEPITLNQDDLYSISIIKNF